MTHLSQVEDYFSKGHQGHLTLLELTHNLILSQACMFHLAAEKNGGGKLV